MKKILSIIVLSALCAGLCPGVCLAQSPAQKAQEIMNDDSYLCGYGMGESISEATQAALNDLISKISINISSTMNIEEDEIMHNGDLTSESRVQMVVNSYAQASLTNTESLIIDADTPVKILRFMKKSEIAKIFEQRTDLIMDYVRMAENCETSRKIDDALKYNYWALNLLKSLQYPNSVKYNGQILMALLPQRIEEILGNLKTRIAGQDGSDLELYITYKDEPVSSVEFSYFDGMSWSPVCAAKDGMGIMELRPNTQTSAIQLSYEYEYIGESHINKEVESVLKLFKGMKFKNAQLPLVSAAAKKTQIDKTAAKEFKSTAATASMVSSSKPMTNASDYERIMKDVVNAIDRSQYDNVRPLFTDGGWQMFESLLKYGKAKIVSAQNTYGFYQLQDEVVCRSIPMQFAFSNNSRRFMEPVTFTFNTDKLIDCVAFGLGEEANRDIFSQGNGLWSEEAKMIIATFLENYKTAFALKRLDYIESIFGDNALIITGHVIKKPATSNSFENGSIQIDGNNEIVKYNRFDKQQYIRHLRQSFNSNEFINIKFTNNDIFKMGVGGELYGIQIHQDYYSTNYGDTGYLFLLVDMNDPKQPIIKVRTWQPNRDPNVNSRLPKNHPDYGIIGPGNF